MGTFLFKIISIFVLVYTLWYLSGGVERGERRHAREEASYFVGVGVQQEAGFESVPQNNDALPVEESEQNDTASSSDIE